ncbi:MAG: O-antigen ligase domain-containing protein [Symploca sp. SIO2G7]|nr:O-antigen ligase domain-containing protein [Symploca sp. SIO2G7]
MSLPSTPAWIAILGLVFFSALCILGGAGSVLRLTFPVGCFAVGAFLYLRHPLFYVSFTWWVYFLTPLVRRLIDHKSGWVDPSPTLLAPVLVTLISFATLARHLPKSNKSGSLPFILSFVGASYGFLIGLAQISPVAATLGFLGWLNPILFGFHLFINWRDYPSYCQNIQRTFLWGVLVMGAYGIWQYLVAPEWDCFWLINTEILSMGTPEPMGIRVWSTMNAPQPFGVVMMAGLLLLMCPQSALRIPAAGAGFLSFLLSSARACWIGWIAGVFIFLPSLKESLQMRLIVSMMVGILLIVPLATIEPFNSAIAPRIESLSNTKDDTSLEDRSEGYNELLDIALFEFVGRGVGSVIEHGSIGSNDSGFLSQLFSLGWLGTIPYIGGVLLIFVELFQGSLAKTDTFFSAARAIAFGAFIQIGLNFVQVGAIGMVLWGFLGIGMAAQKYHRHQQRLQTH